MNSKQTDPTLEQKAFGYVCHICGEQIYDSQPTEHSDEGLIHADCPQADCYEPLPGNVSEHFIEP